MLPSPQTINVRRFDAADTLVFQEPFSFLVATDILSEAKRGSLQRDFPKYKEAGFFPYSEEECGPAIIELIEEVTSPEIADQLGDKLGIKHLSHYPHLVTIRR